MTGQEWVDPPLANATGPLPPPLRFALSRNVEAVLVDIVDQFTAGHLELWQLPYPLNELAWVVWSNANVDRIALGKRLERAEADADFFYAEMCARPAPAQRRAVRSFYGREVA